MAKKHKRVVRKTPTKQKPLTAFESQIANILKESSGKKSAPKEKVPLVTEVIPKGVPRKPHEGGLTITTNPDRLFQMVQEKKQITVKQAATFLGVSERQVEEWGDILEDHKLVKLHYPTFGDVIMNYQEPTKTRAPAGKRKERKKLGKGKKMFFLLLVIVLIGVLVWVFGYNQLLLLSITLQTSGFSLNTLLPVILVIMIIVVVIAILKNLKRKKRLKRHGSKKRVEKKKKRRGKRGKRKV